MISRICDISLLPWLWAVISLYHRWESPDPWQPNPWPMSWSVVRMPCSGTSFLDYSTLIIVVFYNSFITLYLFLNSLRALLCCMVYIQCHQLCRKWDEKFCISPGDFRITFDFRIEVHFSFSFSVMEYKQRISETFEVACASLPCGMCSGSQHALHCDWIVVPLKGVPLPKIVSSSLNPGRENFKSIVLRTL